MYITTSDNTTSLWHNNHHIDDDDDTKRWQGQGEKEVEMTTTGVQPATSNTSGHWYIFFYYYLAKVLSVHHR